MVETVEKKPTVGRRRDPRIEPLVHAAAIHVYAREGWSGFTFDAVARVARVGKPALYRRWASREDLLIDAFDTVRFPTAMDLGSVRADLLDYARQWVEWYSDQDRGLAANRVGSDCLTNPELSNLYDKIIVGPRTQSARDITRRGIERGEIGPTIRSSTIVELLLGAMQAHWAFTTDAQLPTLRRTFPAHAEHLIDIILAGVQAVAPVAQATSSRSRLTRKAADGTRQATAGTRKTTSGTRTAETTKASPAKSSSRRAASPAKTAAVPRVAKSSAAR